MQRSAAAVAVFVEMVVVCVLLTLFGHFVQNKVDLVRREVEAAQSFPQSLLGGDFVRNVVCFGRVQNVLMICQAHQNLAHAFFGQVVQFRLFSVYSVLQSIATSISDR